MEENGDKEDKDDNGDAAKEVMRGKDDIGGTSSGLVGSANGLLLEVTHVSVEPSVSSPLFLMSGNGDDCGGEALLVVVR